IIEGLDELQCDIPNPETKQREDSLLAELDEILLRKDLIWRQKSRELWLKNGDKNSKFFHLSTIIRRRTNHIAAVKGEGNQWIEDPESIGDYFLKNLKDLFTSTSPTFPKDLEGLVEPIITTEENILPTSIPTREEITHALNSIPNLKAPGPDGIPSLVYKHYGNIIKPLLTSAVQSFFFSGKILKEWNNTFITLVPKSKKASTFKDFRPISLCNEDGSMKMGFSRKKSSTQ
ncbi:hypothetical protein CRG98_037127, partial [Punica granatum]